VAAERELAASDCARSGIRGEQRMSVRATALLDADRDGLLDPRLDLGLREELLAASERGQGSLISDFACWASVRSGLRGSWSRRGRSPEALDAGRHAWM